MSVGFAIVVFVFSIGLLIGSAKRRTRAAKAEAGPTETRLTETRESGSAEARSTRRLRPLGVGPIAITVAVAVVIARRLAPRLRPAFIGVVGQQRRAGQAAGRQR
jgi:hypothetical protein